MFFNLTVNTVSETAKNMEASAGFAKQTLDQLCNWMMGKVGAVIIAIVFILIALKVVGLFLKFLNKSFERSKMEASVAGFLLSVIRVAGYILVFITAAAMVGIEVTSFVTILGTASLAVGLALQGALSNLAGGVLILLLKPFQVGDYIVENDKNNEGTVVSIDVFYTKLKTHDNKVIVIPNGILAANSLVNLTDENKRKVEIKIGIAYQTDITKVKTVIHEVINQDTRILTDEPKDIFIDAFEDSGMMLGIRVWVATNDFWPVTWSLREQVKNAFDENGIEIPYNRLEVDVTNK
ncbi:MAG: mechanosensitive ion channel family protein [Lachnospiraceae bacterium]